MFHLGLTVFYFTLKIFFGIITLLYWQFKEFNLNVLQSFKLCRTLFRAF
jgi:hypothetical protein